MSQERREWMNFVADLRAEVERLRSDLDGQNAEIARLCAAIYEQGESPLEQRQQVDPVHYLRTRYVCVSEYNVALDRMEWLRELLTTACDEWAVGSVAFPVPMGEMHHCPKLSKSWYDAARQALSKKEAT